MLPAAAIACFVASMLCVNGVVACAGTTGIAGDLNGDGTVDVLDVQESISEVLGLTECVSDVNGDGLADVLDVVTVVQLALAF